MISDLKPTLWQFLRWCLEIIGGAFIIIIGALLVMAVFYCWFQ